MEEGPSSTAIRILFFFSFLAFNCRLLISSILSFEDEIRKRGEGASKFRIAAAIEASLGALRVVVREIPGAVERAGFMHQRNDGFRANRDKFLFREHAGDQFARKPSF